MLLRIDPESMVKEQGITERLWVGSKFCSTAKFPGFCLVLFISFIYLGRNLLRLQSQFPGWFVLVSWLWKMVSKPSQEWHSGCSFLLLAICPVAIGSCKWFVCLLLFLHSSCKSFLPFSGCELWLVGGWWKSPWKGWEVSISVGRLSLKAGRNTCGNHSSGPLDGCPPCLWLSTGVDCVALPWHGTADCVPVNPQASKGRSRGCIATLCAHPFPLDPPWKKGLAKLWHQC